jgi:hypothetical protein
VSESKLDRAIEDANRPPLPKGPPPLRSFDLVLHHDGAWTHEGQSFRNRRLREKFDKSVRYLPEEGGVYVVQIGHFRGLIDVEEAGFFVDDIDLDAGTVRLSDASTNPLDVASLITSGIDGALLCRVKRDLDPAGVLARFSHSAQAEFLNAVDDEGVSVLLGGTPVKLPSL